MNMTPDHEGPEKSSPDDTRSLRQTRGITVIGDRINSRELFATGRQIVIEHGNETYILRLTAQNKLILTK